MPTEGVCRIDAQVLVKGFGDWSWEVELAGEVDKSSAEKMLFKLSHEQKIQLVWNQLRTKVSWPF
jgi:hypothetical protein